MMDHQTNNVDTQINPDEDQFMLEVTNQYKRLKYLAILSERFGEGSVFVPALNEIRDAFDHLMRYYAVKYDLMQSKSNLKDLEKCIGHLRRGTVYLLDYISILLKEEYYIIIKNSIYNEKDTLEVNTKILPMIDDLIEQVSSITHMKSITDDIQTIDNSINECINKIEYLINFKKGLSPIMVKLSNEDQDILSNKKQINIKFKTDLIIAVLTGAALGITILYFLKSVP